jgi:hypothetical protein
MKQLVPLILLSFMLCGPLQAQEQKGDTAAGGKSKMTFDFYASYSMALGQYKEVDPEADKSGFAGGGFLAQIKINWLGKKDFGLGISYAFQQNYLQKGTADLIIPGGDTSGLGEKPWSNHYLLAGLVMVKEINKWTVDAGMLVGLVIANSNTFTIEVPPPDSVSLATLSSGAGVGFGYQFRVTGGYRISNRVMVTAGFALMGGSPSRKKDLYYYSYVEDPPGSGFYRGVYQGSETVIKKKISTFNPGVALIIKL